MRSLAIHPRILVEIGRTSNVLFRGSWMWIRLFRFTWVCIHPGNDKMASSLWTEGDCCKFVSVLCHQRRWAVGNNVVLIFPSGSFFKRPWRFGWTSPQSKKREREREEGRGEKGWSLDPGRWSHSDILEGVWGKCNFWLHVHIISFSVNNTKVTSI